MDVGVVLGRYGSTTKDNLWEGHRSYNILGGGCQALKGWQSFVTNHRFSRDWLVFWTIWDGRKVRGIVHWLRTVEQHRVESGGHERERGRVWVTRLGCDEVSEVVGYVSK